ncbi:MAG: dTDP-glucose 4,6-dehydratase [Candidatus Raymondbacteria bacterium RifOxyA12_full_50_37]|uniref:dTDP-glucose 4,6-dehydratase n=1 Tax=Candidatus Raymondbacteria bacterium RIFOXYD12_FULL_49_13 TaxID=1817890 RepID=A0A1F7F962_UNCRA|nr:MAG: dTDP-glucose 4,6-dehydratase [Candidatus Raymondbacteria bacterium RifOxyA12_full_50_37]OGJ85431.1 MAG: dTDP-glucose 4,6-dehydratase [Candidatus Raymondbacteria bacterium RIFOXYA2_FULL_49_16]OGJ91049.1 MAG: dTDP-glucose 4,6-dehydratase [Candidatus Raymondbacteria bacterium RifOxyB12_full_50_8]OGJ94939.1 MAG: dTDP-glucose 4,6-dehydratase [Candidatus Raymondbacteria bacterium RIFOXYC2_FULL_50_21]OGK03056.1 MAG: dTDP-glucose 4,6-dehydratase [Candidatus Raymondbacteria bacterium RIFOXYD12_F
MRLLVTGGCGFIGSNFILHVLEKEKDIQIVNLDSLTYAGNAENLSSISGNQRYTFIQGTINDPETVENAMTGIGAVVHFAAESHVDKSITGPLIFTQTNVLGTHLLLETARKKKIPRFVHVSTDEVYGSLERNGGLFTEQTPLAPNSPYSASKAASDMLVRSYFHTFKFPGTITRCSNNYGPLQFPEKLIPLLITNLMENKRIPIYGKGENIRDWLHVRDHCSAIFTVLQKGREGEVYNIGGLNEWTNIDIAREILRLMGKDESYIEYVVDRPGHDFRYAIDASKIMGRLGWKPAYTFENGLAETVAWYRENEAWWRPLKERNSSWKRL